ncbi:MAG TPA: hypothetical protein VGA60_03405 [Kiloniellales bacterium]
MNNILYAARYYLGGRSGLILLAVAVLGVGAMLNWSWLVAIGVAPLLLVLAPCAAMCALGLCMNKAGGKSRASGTKVPTEGSNTKGASDGSA